MKYIIFMLLSVSLSVMIYSHHQMTERAIYWMERCDAAESVINQVEEDQKDYVLDVLCEGDAYQEWLEYRQ